MTPYLLAASAPQSPSFLVLVAPYVLIALIFYVLLIRPAQQRRKDLERQVDALKKGDKVVTKGGLYGEVVKAEERTVILKLGDNVKVKIAKWGIAGLEGSEEERKGVQ